MSYPNAHSLPTCPHVFVSTTPTGSERRVWWVIALTATMMVAEIAAGHTFGSMALVADGWHMSTHAAALLITALAYRFARRHAGDARFAWGTGKVGDLGGFASAVVLAVVAALIGWDSVQRLLNPVPIAFADAMLVAVLGLLVNVLCAWLLGVEHHHHHHEHTHEHEHDEHEHEAHHHHHHHQDNNLRAAYVHVLADALTSVLAIVALLLGRLWGWSWADPLIGILGAVVVARWAWTLMRQCASVLLDASVQGQQLRQHIAARLQAQRLSVQDLHVWQVGTGHFAAIVCVQSHDAQAVQHRCRAALADVQQLSHLNVEVLEP